jgi:transposase
VAEQRAQWPDRVASVASGGLVFVDESGAHLQMTRRYGRSPSHQRLVGHIPQGPYLTATLIAGIRRHGPSAPWIFEGPMDGEMFLAWVRIGLAPTLRKGETVILDNLAIHKVQGVRQTIEATGAHLKYLPPYSPDFNPIENLWSKVKQSLRSANPRTWRQLLNAAKTAFAVVSVDDCQGFFSNAGYAT